jgi:hypothetical protein
MGHVEAAELLALGLEIDPGRDPEGLVQLPARRLGMDLASSSGKLARLSTAGGRA